MGKNKLGKIVLHRETVRDLTSEDLDQVAGAAKGTLTTNNPTCTSCAAPC